MIGRFSVWHDAVPNNRSKKKKRKKRTYAYFPRDSQDDFKDIFSISFSFLSAWVPRGSLGSFNDLFTMSFSFLSAFLFPSEFYIMSVVGVVFKNAENFLTFALLVSFTQGRLNLFSSHLVLCLYDVSFPSTAVSRLLPFWRPTTFWRYPLTPVLKCSQEWLNRPRL